jgi:GR25 family glycosyltransferase involved in LPS biosynthesis/glycosyltransferase involved in cell wall biosynthesis
MPKPTIVFYIGYTNLHAPMYGSEIALVNLAKALSTYFQVFILTPFHNPNHLLNLDYISLKDYLDNDFDYLVISRYVNAFLHIPVRATKTFLWMHDVVLQPSFMAGNLPESGRWLLANVHYDGIVVQTEWHAQNFRGVYPEAHSLVVLGNGIDLSNFAVALPKVPYRFMWSSSPIRGLTTMLRIFRLILEKYPQATLHVCRGPEEMTPEQLQTMQAMAPAVVYRGKLSNYEVAREFLEAEVWLYPTDFAETFCISALEAQAAGCVAISTDLAALKEMNQYTEALLPTDYFDRENEFFRMVDTLFANEREKLHQYLASKKEIIREWVTSQSWEKRAEEWKQLLETGTLAKNAFETPPPKRERWFESLIAKPEETVTKPVESVQEDTFDLSSVRIYVLNLLKRTDRMEHMVRLLSNFPLTRFEAVNGAKVEKSEWVAQVLGNRNFPKKNPYPLHNFEKGVVGCALSHYQMWVLAAQREHPTVIFEDDIQLHDKFHKFFPVLMKHLLTTKETWEVCFLGYLDDVPDYQDEIASVFSFVKKSEEYPTGDEDSFKLRRFNPTSARSHGGGTHGYCVSPRGARKLLELVEKYGIAQPVDWFMVEMFSEMVALKCDPHFVEPDPKWGSDIQGCP